MDQWRAWEPLRDDSNAGLGLLLCHDADSRLWTCMHTHTLLQHLKKTVPRLHTHSNTPPLVSITSTNPLPSPPIPFTLKQTHTHAHIISQFATPGSPGTEGAGRPMAELLAKLGLAPAGHSAIPDPLTPEQPQTAAIQAVPPHTSSFSWCINIILNSL